MDDPIGRQGASEQQADRYRGGGDVSRAQAPVGAHDVRAGVDPAAGSWRLAAGGARRGAPGWTRDNTIAKLLAKLHPLSTPSFQRRCNWHPIRQAAAPLREYVESIR